MKQPNKVRSSKSRRWLLSIRAVLAIAALGLANQQFLHATMATVYTDESSFVAAIQPGYYLEDFNSLLLLPGPHPNTTFSDGGFTYEATAVSGLYVVSPGGNKALSVQEQRDDLVVYFKSGNVTAVGGDFFLTMESGDFSPGSLTVTLSDSTSVTLASTPGDFRGFVTSPSGPVITSLTIHNLSPGAYSTMDHFYVGAVPEPTTMIAGALLLIPCGMTVLRLKRRNSKA